MSAEVVLIGFLKGLTTLIAETAFQASVSGFIDRTREKRIYKKINDAIQGAFDNALQTSGDFALDVDDISLREYLSSSRVVIEIRKLFSPQDHPDTEVLVDAWTDKFPNSQGGQVRILFQLFFNRLRKNLWEIKELEGVLYRKESLSRLYDIKADTERILSLVTPSDIAVQGEQVLNPVEEELQAKLESYRELIRSGRPKASLDLLLSLEKTMQGQAISVQIRSRLIGLIGFCHYLLGNHDKTVKQFQDALLLTPNNPKTLANAALAFLITNETADAIKHAEKAIELGGVTPLRELY